MKQKGSYEDNILQLEDILRRLEVGDIALEEGLSLFEKGISLIKSCQNQLEKAAERIQVLSAEEENIPFVSAGEE